jgi:hypothetical protein
VVILPTGEKLVTYREAARRLGVAEATIVAWLGWGWMHASPYRIEGRRYLQLDEIERVAALRGSSTSRLMTLGEAADYLGTPIGKLRSQI